MKLSKQTIQILNWCSLLQDAIYIEPGQVLDTASENKATRLRAVVAEAFPAAWGIKPLKPVLRHLAEGTELHWDDATAARLCSGRQTLTIKQVSDKLILRIRGAFPKLEFEESFFLHHDDAFEIRRWAKRQPDGFVWFGSAGPKMKLQIQLRDSMEESSAICCIDPVAPASLSRSFGMSIRLKHLHLMEGSYQVLLSLCGAALFRWKSADVDVLVVAKAGR